MLTQMGKKMHTRFIVVIVVMCAVFGCSRPVSRFPSRQIIPSVNRYALEADMQDSVCVLYAGCGHLVIEFQNEIMLIDPFFSTQPFYRRKIKSDTGALTRFNRILETHAIDLSKTTSVWIAHSHYDHMMDLPLLLRQKILPQGVPVYGNAFGDDILFNFMNPGQYHSLGAREVYDPTQQNSDLPWITVSPSMRVLPILSDHAPHYKLGPVAFHLMKGRPKHGYFQDTYRTAETVTRRSQWKEGCTYSFLVDLMEKDKIVCRLFVQTSASHFPYGSPPANVLAERPVDVAFLCVASSNYVKPYPIEILRTLKPKKTVLIHWEDFFLKPLDFEDARLVRFTNFRRFDKRMRRNGLVLAPQHFSMPRPGTLITIR